MAAWIKQSEAPEAGYIASLVAIGKQLGNLNGVGNGVLTPAAQKAIEENEQRFRTASARRLR